MPSVRLDARAVVTFVLSAIAGFAFAGLLVTYYLNLSKLGLVRLLDLLSVCLRSGVAWSVWEVAVYVPPPPFPSPSRAV